MLFASFSGLGDAIDANDPCTLNPSDPACVAFYSGSAAASCNVDKDCPNGQTCNAVSGFCEPLATSATPGITADFSKWWGSSLLNPSTWGMPTAGPSIRVGTAPQAPSVAGAIGKVFSVTGLITIALLGGAGYGGYRLYKKHKRK